MSDPSPAAEIEAVAGAKRPLNDDQPQESKLLHQVRVDNLPMSDIKEIKQFLKDKGFQSISKAPKWRYAMCTFESEAEAQQAMDNLKDVQYKGKLLTTKSFTQSEESYRDRFNKKKKNNKKNEPAPEDDTRTPAERLAFQVTPLFNVPYEDQLKQKKKILMKTMYELKKKIGEMKDQSERSKGQVDWSTEPGFPFGEMEVVASPEVDGYRTKCEFTVGKDLDGQITVGFLLGLFRHGIVNVLDPSETKNVPEIAKKIAANMQEYIRASEYPIYDREEKKGVWRTIMTKTQRTGDVLLLIQIKPEDMTEEQVAALKQDLLTYWTSDAMKNDKGIVVTTLIVQVWDGLSNGITDRGTDDILYGDGYVYEELLGSRFRLSSSAFFQVNTPACELLYSKCADWCNLDKTKRTTLLDLCCGTGTIGITMAKDVERVIGVDIVPEAIVDARANAERNNVTNATYFANKVEDRLDVLTRKEDEEIVAVLDPPRNGVHASVIRAIRESPAIDKVIYISCDAKQALSNFVSLCRPESNRFSGKPFVPKRTAAVDLFPHTQHCELVIEFERIPSTTNDTAIIDTTDVPA
ncbi:S-adenosyl-L-methionine-dependent methyltransferase [Hesseltinella vesiculosa]|uniref:S-adenosyl-L-methionine-dependent methyltransferase n=1 Tax=Hesseltinella vesiculosa TaxID=101127 RepID=A0A1X2G7P6_9FUNG|nr:S-adenosyl-L-methionine-dependent methyltransferase [Hesseltinella vesiculosa]